MAGGNKTRHVLNNELDKILKHLEAAQASCMVFESVVKANCQYGDETERLLLQLPVIMAQNIEIFANLIVDVRGKL